MNHYAARQRASDGLWFYTVKERGGTYAVGYCAEDCAGHETIAEACEHFRQYMIDQADYGRTMSNAQRRCRVCGAWTQRLVYVADAYPYVLCEAHQNREALEQVVRPVGESWGNL